MLAFKYKSGQIMGGRTLVGVFQGVDGRGGDDFDGIALDLFNIGRNAGLKSGFLFPDSDNGFFVDGFDQLFALCHLSGFHPSQIGASRQQVIDGQVVAEQTFFIIFQVVD